MCVLISLLTQVTWQIALNDDDDCWGFQLPFSNFSEGIFWELNLGCQITSPSPYRLS